MMLQSTVLKVAEELLAYSILMEHIQGAKLQDAIFMRIQAERLVDAIERAREQ